MATVTTNDQHYKDIADAIRAKTGGTEQMLPAQMPAAIAGISGGGGDIIISGLTYVPGTPLSFTISGWDAAVQGTTYTLKADGYKIGANGLQIGLPADSSTVNTQAVVAAALTLANATVTAPNMEKNIVGYTTLEIVAVTSPWLSLGWRKRSLSPSPQRLFPVFLYLPLRKFLLRLLQKPSNLQVLLSGHQRITIMDLVGLWVRQFIQPLLHLHLSLVINLLVLHLTSLL